ncbi:MAG: LuxR C-terminal-related transcriptional regulator [Actinomycetota bacterium]|nr:LuxR C-terminal-related transcriptional regulator [Actinomycetota bacterium]
MDQADKSPRRSAFAPRTTTFIGRDVALRDISRLLETRRLLTLVGPGGCGKTSLAVAIGRALEDGYDDGGTFVDLAPVHAGDLVPNAVAAAVGLSEQGSKALDEVVLAGLAARHQLLVVDNCEGLLDSCAPLIDAILRRCPQVTVLTTSREPLGVDGETTWRVPSLTLPASGADDPLGALVDSDAGALLLDRAQLARPDLRWSADDAVAATRICRRLDGIPLALELAASRLRAYSPVELVDALDDRFALLTAGPRTAPPRQRTLEASIAWSYDLLNDSTATLLRRLSVFAGTFVLDDARAVCAGGGIAASEIGGLLADLVDRSLVQSERDGYRLLESVAEYAVQRRSGGEDERARLAHLSYVASVAHEFGRRAESAEHLGLGERINRLLGDMRSAMGWAMRTGREVDAMRLAADLRLYWVIEGRMQEGRQWLESALSAERGSDPDDRAHALLAAAYLSLHSFDPRRQAELTSEAVELGHSSEDPKLRSRSMVLDGWSKVFVDPVLARRLLEAARDLAAELGESPRVEFASFGCGAAAVLTGDLDGAARELEHGIELAARRNTYGVSFGRGALGYVRLLTGHVDDAIRLTSEALAVAGHDARALVGQWHALALAHAGRIEEAREEVRGVLSDAAGIGNPTYIAAVDGAWVELAGGDSAAATTLLSTALPDLGMVGESWYEAQAYRLLGDAAEAAGDPAAAREHRQQAMHIADRGGNPLARTVALIGLARSTDDDPARVRTLLRDAIRAASGARYAIGLIDAAETLAVATGAIADTAVRAGLLDAIDADRERTGYVRFPCDVAHYHRARQAVGHRTEAAENGHRAIDVLGIHDAIAAAFSGDRRAPRPVDGWHSLTPAELRVTLLVAEGLTNPEIGQQLFLSKRTVQSHLSKVFAKLDVTGRAELAATVARETAEPR